MGCRFGHINLSRKWQGMQARTAWFTPRKPGWTLRAGLALSWLDLASSTFQRNTERSRVHFQMLRVCLHFQLITYRDKFLTTVLRKRLYRVIYHLRWRNEKIYRFTKRNVLFTLSNANWSKQVLRRLWSLDIERQNFAKITFTTKFRCKQRLALFYCKS